MPVNSRAKGARGEYLVRDLLRQTSGLQFERVPASGALSYLKGDLYVPHETNRFCIEVKNYEESPLTDKLFTNKSNYIIKWWEKVQEQATGGEQEPLLIFKYNRSKLFVVTEIEPHHVEKHIFVFWLNCYIMLLEDWLAEESIEWLKPSKT